MKIDTSRATKRIGSRYPSPYDVPCQNREVTPLSDLAGLSQFGVHQVLLPPGAWSSQRHWHSHEDEFVYILSGTATLVTDAGEVQLHPGESAGFKAGTRDGHCLQNRSSSDVVFLVVGSRSNDDYGEYPDIDMKFGPGRYSGKPAFTHKDGSSF